MPGFGPARSERPLGLHPRPCRRCTPVADRLVTHRRWGLYAFGLPVLALDAHWTTCTRCDRRGGSPRLALPTVVTASLVLAALFGRGVTGAWTLFAFVGLAALWGVWMTGHALDRAADRRLVPLPSLRQLRARPVGHRVRTARSVVRRVHKVSAGIRRVNRLFRPLRRAARRRRQAAPGTP